MIKRLIKSAVMATVGAAFLGNGCLGGEFWRNLFWGAAIYTGAEFITDNGNVFDLFPSGNVVDQNG